MRNRSASVRTRASPWSGNSTQNSSPAGRARTGSRLFGLLEELGSAERTGERVGDGEFGESALLIVGAALGVLYSQVADKARDQRHRREQQAENRVGPVGCVIDHEGQEEGMAGQRADDDVGEQRRQRQQQQAQPKVFRRGDQEPRQESDRRAQHGRHAHLLEGSELQTPERLLATGAAPIGGNGLVGSQ
ncbi:hypothetical protein [Variovorax sp. PBL-E5]|uniref:hypothetical protein n=1 Tax=Variovorax sp. PBL-E5 TaxID=434014 RepID=UPI0013A5B144|nr:hypothetical protein [Variovorax sp. PBL-E5]